MTDVPAVAEEQPKLFTYCSALYAAFDEGAQTTDNVRVWSGRLLEVCDSIGIPRGGYSRVINMLRKMGCVEQVSRGFRGNALSEFLLFQPPTAEVWSAANVKSASGDLTKAPTLDRLSAEVSDLQKQIGGLNIPEALKNIEGQIAELRTLVEQSK